MYNVADLPAVRTQAAKAEAEKASPPLSAKPTQLSSQATEATVNSKPSLKFDNGRYYVDDNKK